MLVVRCLEAKQFHLGSALEELRSISMHHTRGQQAHPVEFEPSKK